MNNIQDFINYSKRNYISESHSDKNDNVILSVSDKSKLESVIKFLKQKVSHPTLNPRLSQMYSSIIEDLVDILNNFGKNTDYIEGLIQRWNEYTHSPSIDISKIIFYLFSKKEFDKGEIRQITSEFTALMDVIIGGKIINLTSILKHTTLLKNSYDKTIIKLLNDTSLSHGSRGSSGKGESLMAFLCNLSDLIYEIPPLKDGDIKIKDIIYDIKYIENYNLTANFGIVENFFTIKDDKIFDINVDVGDVSNSPNKINIGFTWNDKSVGVFGIPYSTDNKINNPRYYLMKNERAKKGNDGNSLMTSKIQLEITNQILSQYFNLRDSIELMIIWGESDELKLKVINKENVLSQNIIYCPFNKGSEFPIRLY